MKKITTILGALATVAVVAAPAIAADMRMPMKAPPPVAPIFTWTGCYIGGFAGGAVGGDVSVAEGVSTGGVFPAGTTYNAGAASYGYDLDSSFIGGGTLGCNYQISQFVLGIEGEAGYIRLRGAAVDPNSFATLSDVRDATVVGDWYGVIAGRVGVAFDRVLLYAKGGVAFIDATSAVLDTCAIGGCGPALIAASGSNDSVTWAAGAGVEWAFAPNWSVKGEYLHIGRSDSYATCGAGAGAAAGSVFCWTHRVDGIHTGKFGINYRF